MKISNLISSLVVGAIASPVFAFSSAPKIASRIVPLAISNVGKVGSTLKIDHGVDFATALVAIPVEVTLPDACTTFAGQETTALKSGVGTVAPNASLTLKGLQDPQDPACISVAVLPKPVLLTLPIRYALNTFVLDASRTVKIGNAGSYTVSLASDSEKVTISKVSP
jgi:hypothetical protein